MGAHHGKYDKVRCVGNESVWSEGLLDIEVTFYDQMKRTR